MSLDTINFCYITINVRCIKNAHIYDQSTKRQ